MQKDDRIFAAVGACVVCAVALVAALMWLSSGITVDAPQRATVVVPDPTVPTPEASLASVSESVEVGTPVESEESLFRAAVARLSSHPQLASYVLNDRLLRRFVLAVDAIAGGYSPSNQVDFMRPERPFIVREDGGRLVVAAGTYRRYDIVSEVFASLETDGAIEIFREFSPRLDEIYHEVGWANDGFEDRLREAVDHLLEVSAPTGQVEVEQRAIVYAYAEDRFENLTDAQKHLLRMGPQNVAAVQAKLRELRDAMGWPERAEPVLTAELEPEVEENVMPLIADAAPVVEPDPAFETTGATEEP